MEISVVVPVYIAKPEHLAMAIKCIETARKTTKLPYELIIVETCSDYLRDYADIHIYEKERSDIHKSVNRAFKVASGEYVVLLTDDVFVSENWLEYLIKTFEEMADCGISTLASTQFNHQKENKIEEAFWFSLVAIPQWLFKKIGYFDEDYKRVWADTDFVIKTYKAGYKIYRNHNCVVEHKSGSTVYGEGGHKEAYVDGRLLFNKKHEGCDLPIFHRLR